MNRKGNRTSGNQALAAALYGSTTSEYREIAKVFAALEKLGSASPEALMVKTGLPGVAVRYALTKLQDANAIVYSRPSGLWFV